jgi:hypothetical protein
MKCDCGRRELRAAMFMLVICTAMNAAYGLAGVPWWAISLMMGATGFLLIMLAGSTDEDGDRDDA